VVCSILRGGGAKGGAPRAGGERTPTNPPLPSSPAVSLAEARRLATAALAQVAQGVDPRIAKQRAKAEATERTRDTVERHAAQYLEWKGGRVRPNTLRQIEHVVADFILPAWQGPAVQ